MNRRKPAMKSWVLATSLYVACALPLAVCADVPAPQETRSVWSGVYTKEQAERGRVTYLGRCAQCHAENLAGNPPAPPLRGTSFAARWNGQSVRDIHSRIRSTMPVDEPGSLSREETFDIVSYLFQANGYPGGASELSGMPTDLQQIKITAQNE